MFSVIIIPALPSYVCNGISVMSMIFNKALIIKKQLKSHYHYTVNTSFKAARRDWAGNRTEEGIVGTKLTLFEGAKAQCSVLGP